MAGLRSRARCQTDKREITVKCPDSPRRRPGLKGQDLNRLFWIHISIIIITYFISNSDRAGCPDGPASTTSRKENVDVYEESDRGASGGPIAPLADARGFRIEGESPRWASPPPRPGPRRRLPGSIHPIPGRNLSSTLLPLPQPRRDDGAGARPPSSPPVIAPPPPSLAGSAKPPVAIPSPPSILGQEVRPIDLNTALRLAGVENPELNLARQRVVEAGGLPDVRRRPDPADAQPRDQLRLAHRHAPAIQRQHPLGQPERRLRRGGGQRRRGGHGQHPRACSSAGTSARGSSPT